MTPLHLACRYNSRTATQFLLAQAAKTHVMNYVINMKDVKGRTPLHYATRRGHDMVIKVRNRMHGWGGKWLLEGQAQTRWGLENNGMIE